MIADESQLQRTREAIVDLESAVEALKREVLPVNAERFALMAEPVIEDIRKLQSEVDEYVGISAAIWQEAAFWLKLEGPELELADASVSLLSSKLNAVRKGVEDATLFIQEDTQRALPASTIKEACDLRIVAWRPGSVQVGLRLPVVSVSPLQENAPESVARRGLRLFLSVVTWAGGDHGVEELVKLIPNAAKRDLLLNRVKRLTPGPRSKLTLVEFSGRELPEQRAVQLNASALAHIRFGEINGAGLALSYGGGAETRWPKAAYSPSLPNYSGIPSLNAGTAPERSGPVTIRGSLREVNLDGGTFIVRDSSGKQTTFQVPDELHLLMDEAKRGLGREVLVVGRPTHYRNFLVVAKITVS